MILKASTDEGTGQSSEDEGLDDGDAVSLSSPISCATSPSELLGFKTEPVPELEGLMTLKAPRENGKTLLVVVLGLHRDMKFNFYYTKDKETFADITEALVKIPLVLW